MDLEDYRILEQVLPEDYLKLSSGEFIKSLPELVENLDKMGDDVFEFHVYGDNNDFSEWILDVYGDEKLSEKVRKIKKKKDILKILKVELDKYRKNRTLKIDIPKNKKDILEILSGVGHGM